MSGISPTDGLPLWCRRVVVARRLDDTLRAGGSTMCIWMEYDIYDCVHIGICMDTAGHGKGEYHHAYANDVHGCAVMVVCVACTWD